MQDPLIGRQVGDYTIVEMLGRGGMARVYKGYDARLDRYAAIKVIEYHLLTEANAADYRSRFQREARAVARLRHPGIVTLYQFGEFENLYYMAMAFIEGRDLAHILREAADKGERLPQTTILSIMRDVAAALDYAHGEGVIHRDVKPSNIMITNRGSAVLTDFGLALNVPEGSIGSTFGTVHYVAPEQALSSAKAVPQSDLYSLGIVLYQMLTGRVPFDDPSMATVVLRILNDPPQPPRSIDPNISPDVEAVVMRALAKTPEQRYASGQELVDALEKAFSVAQTKPSPPQTSFDDSEPLLVFVGSKTKTGEQATTPKDDSNATADTPPPPPPPTTPPPTMNVTPTPAAAQPPQKSSRLPLIIGGIAALIIIGAIIVLGSGGGFGAAAAPTETRTPTEVVVVAADTETPTNTRTRTQPPTEANTPSLTPSQTPSNTPTETRTPTNTQTPSITPSFTVTASNTPSRTPTNTRTFTPSPTPTPDDPVVLIYDERGFILLNRSDHPVDVSSLEFVLVTESGEQFIMGSWELNSSEPLFAFRPGSCYQLVPFGVTDPDIPPMCRQRAGWQSLSQRRMFWRHSEPSTSFEVRQQGDLLATCPINEGECYIPAEE